MSVSVVISTYNAGHFIDDALQSVVQQTVQPDEIIVVDDASTDGTADRVDRILATISIPSRILRLQTNSGSPVVPLNVGVAAARSELISILDQDDLFQPSKLEAQSRVLMALPDLSFVFSQWDYVSDRAQSRRLWMKRMSDLTGAMRANDLCYCCDGGAALRLFLQHEMIAGGYPGFMFRRQFWEKKGGFDSGYTIASDYEFICWLCTQTDVAFLPEVHYQHREHGNNLSRHELRRIIEALRIVVTYYDHVSGDLPESEFRRIVCRKMRGISKSFASMGYWKHAYRTHALRFRIRGPGDTCQQLVQGILLLLRTADRRSRKRFRGYGGEEATAVMDEMSTIMASLKAA